MQKWFYSLLFILSFNFCFSNEVDIIIKNIRSQHFTEASLLLSNSTLNNNLKNELQFYKILNEKYGVYKDTVDVQFIQKKYPDKTYIKSLYLLNSGLYDFLYNYNAESKAFKNLNKALEIALYLKNKVLVCEIIKTILKYYNDLFLIEDVSYKYYLNTYKLNVYDNTEDKILTLTNLNFKLFDNEFSLTIKEVQQLKDLASNFNNDYFTSKAKLLLSIFYENNNGDFIKTNALRKEALKLVSKHKEGLYIEKGYAAKISLGIGFYKEKKPLKAIKVLQNIKSKYKGKSIDRVLLFKYFWLSQSYNKIGKKDSALINLQTNMILRKNFNQNKHNVIISNLNKEFELNHKTKQINTLNKYNKTLNSRMNIIIPAVSIVILLLGIVFYLYKKYYHKSEVLAEEKSETIKKIDELKQIVVKNHIILKDKTKVYIADLLYIKSDDHYLKIFLSNGKNHFVRGKLNKITKELPPNFIRCHRSYIVNRNFIKQINNDNIILVDKTEIPLSRTYKKKL